MGKIKNQKCFEFLLILAFEQTKEHISRQVQPLKMLNKSKKKFLGNTNFQRPCAQPKSNISKWNFVIGVL